MKDFENKYNFEIDFEKSNNIKNENFIENKEEIEKFIDSGNFPKKKDEKNISTMNIISNEYSEIDKYKIKVDHMTEYQKLIKRININKKIVSLFIENYYLDDFNNTRRGIYFFFSIPFITFFGFLIMNPFHPLRRMCFLISLLGTTGFTTISFKKDMELLATKQSSLGHKVKFLYFLSLYFNNVNLILFRYVF